MPGLFGFTIKGLSNNEVKNSSRRMLDALKWNSRAKSDVIFIDDVLCASRAHNSLINTDEQPFTAHGVKIWFDGEIYNRNEISSKYNLPLTGSWPAFIGTLYVKMPKLEFLEDIDGIYSCLIYDRACGNIFIITDRYGLRHIYLSKTKNNIIWSSEIKTFKEFPKFHCSIDREALEDFIETGHLTGDKTLLSKVKLLSSGTYLKWNIADSSATEIKYWCWNKIKKGPSGISFKESVETLGDLFVKAVDSRILKGEKIGLALSGGLDSRAILAALPESQYETYTVGIPNSKDVLTAAKVAKLKNTNHHVYYLNATNWLNPRIEAVWWTDGQFNIMHMHGVEVIPQIGQLFDICLNGFLGDAVIGGLYIGDPRWGFVEKFENRARRFISLGPKMHDPFNIVRFPFAENKLVEFCYSLPEEMREGWNIYKKMLLKMFPRFFNKIPWQKTGYPISWTESRKALDRFGKRIGRKMSSCLGYVSNYGQENYLFTDYPSWIRMEPARSFFFNLLTDEKALYLEYIDAKEVRESLARHFKGQDTSERLCLYLTFEIWLRQFFKGEI